MKKQLRELKEAPQQENAKLQEELTSLRALAARDRWTMPKSYGMLDEAKFLEKTYEKVRFGGFGLPDVAITLICRHQLLLIKDEYEPQVASHVENVLKKKFDAFTSEEEVEAAVTGALVDMRGAAKKKRKGTERQTGPGGSGGQHHKGEHPNPNFRGRPRT